MPGEKGQNDVLIKEGWVNRESFVKAVRHQGPATGIRDKAEGWSNLFIIDPFRISFYLISR